MAIRLSAFVSIFFLSLVLLSSTAAADVIFPEEEACYGAEEREACEVDDVLGECRSQETCRADYSDLDEDGQPGTICTMELHCVLVEEDPNENGDDDNGDDSGDDDNGDENGDENGDDSGESSDEDEDAEDSSSCSSISVNSGMVPMVSFVLGAFLLIGIRRRTKRAS